MTEKDYAPKRNENKKMIVETGKKQASNTPIKKEEKVEKKVAKPSKEEVKEETKKVEEKKETDVKKEGEKEKTEDKKEDVKKTEEKKPVQTKPKIKKTEAVVNSNNLPISTKHSIAVCKFIKGKKIERAIEDLEKVANKKKPVPMKGEIPHRKGKGISSGRYPKKAAEHFIKLLKSLSANANLHEIENPFIANAVANLGARPYGRFGRIKRKRTHIQIIAKKLNQKKIEVKK